MKRYRGDAVEPRRFLTSVFDAGEWFSFSSLSLYPWREEPPDRITGYKLIYTRADLNCDNGISVPT